MTKFARIESDNGNLAFYSPYDAAMLNEFKGSIPSHDRRWDGDRKCWLVDAQHLAALEHLCSRYGLAVTKRIQAAAAVPQTVQRIMEVRYIGAPKEREDGSFTAMGNVDGEWSLILPQDVLRAWFEIGGISAAPQAPITYYAALGVRPNATAEEVKKGYRQMAKRWHPDVNRDPDATGMFKRIGAAYEVLSDPGKRRRYDAGLALEATLGRAEKLTTTRYSDWRPPVRCGLLLVEGQERLGRLIVSKILQWQPIVDARGRELVTSWPVGADTWLEAWI